MLSTKRRQRFCEAYVFETNEIARKAAYRAGYRAKLVAGRPWGELPPGVKKALDEQASRLMADPRIKAEIARFQRERDRRQRLETAPTRMAALLRATKLSRGTAQWLESTQRRGEWLGHWEKRLHEEDRVLWAGIRKAPDQRSASEKHALRRLGFDPRADFGAHHLPSLMLAPLATTGIDGPLMCSDRPLTVGEPEIPALLRLSQLPVTPITSEPE